MNDRKTEDFSDSLFGYGSLPQLEMAILSRVGGRPHNEDACGHWHSPQYVCCVVSDGAGGHGGGDVASRIAVRYVLERFAQAPTIRVDDIRQLLLDANAEVIRRRADAPAQRDMHATVVALFVDLERGQAVWGHVGDSRLYLFREGQMLAHTRDHSTVQALVESGLLRADQLRTHPRRSELLSALGTDPEYLQVAVSRGPWAMRDRDAFLLCTDGMWEWLDEVEISASLARATTPADWLARLEQMVVRAAKASGKAEYDNFTGLALWVGLSGD